MLAVFLEIDHAKLECMEKSIKIFTSHKMWIRIPTIISPKPRSFKQFSYEPVLKLSENVYFTTV